MLLHYVIPEINCDMTSMLEYLSLTGYHDIDNSQWLAQIVMIGGPGTIILYQQILYKVGGPFSQKLHIHVEGGVDLHVVIYSAECELGSLAV